MKSYDQPPVVKVEENKVEKNIFDQNLLNVDIEHFKNQMIGETPGLDAEDILNTNKGFSYFLENLDLNNSGDLISKLFNIDRGVTWICESLYSEIEKGENTKADNTQLKEYLQKSIQNLIDCYCSILDTKKVGYLIELIIQDSFSRLKFACFRSGIKILNGAFDTKHNGPANLPFAVMIPNMPNSRERDFQSGSFLSKGEIFRIKGGYVDKQGIDGGWNSIDDIKEYTDINPKLVNSKNIINLMTFDNFLRDNYDLPINDISFVEKIYLYNYLLTTSYYKFQFNFKPSLNKQLDKTSFIRTFLSIEQGGKEMGDKIIGLGEKLPEDVAQKVFTKYGEIIDNVNKISEFARTNFTKGIETNPELVKKIEETLYIKGKQLLSQTYDDINNKKEVNYEDIGKQLDRINADTITTFAIFKQAVKNGEKLPIESIEGSVFSKKEATDISLNQQNEMLELYESNWKNHPDRNFVESLKSYFKTAFAPEDNKQKNYFYTFEKDNNIRAFVRFEKQNDASFYASALNVDEASKNFGLGEAMMDEALTREAKKYILHASCRKDNPSNMRYFEKGFISRGFKKTNETEEFDLIWDENRNKDIKSKQKSQEELINIQNTDEIEIKKSKDLESLHNEIPEGKSLVRCFVNNGEWYAVYEKVEEDYGMNLGETK